MKTIAIIRKAYLVKFVDANKKYPVSYTINNNGKKIPGPSEILGKDLTENQIYELFVNELL